MTQNKLGLRLCDEDSAGRVRPWREKKLENLTYAEYLEVLNFRKAHRVKDCGQTLRFEVRADGTKKLYQAWFCHSRLCPLCNWRRSKKDAYELSEVLDEAHRLEPKARFIFLTLTEKNAGFGELKEDLKALNRSLYRLFQYKVVKRDLVGFARATEVTVNRKDRTFHPHVHVLLMVKSTYFSSRNGHYLSQKKWAKLWQKARKLDYTPVVSVEAVKPSRKNRSLVASAKEVAKYQVKSGDYLSDDMESDLEVVDELEHALAGTRRLGFGGLLKKIRARLFGKEVSEESEDLINTGDDDKNKDGVIGEVVYQWNSKVRDYIHFT